MAGLFPVASLVVDGQDIGDLLDRRLMSLSISAQRGDEADQLDLEISDHDGRMAIPKEGAVISVGLGWRGQALKSMGLFKADEVSWEGPPGKITVRARSADFTADMRIRRERSWRDTTLGAVLRQVAGGAGLTPRIAADLDARPIKILAQSRESDVAMIRRLGAEHDAVATIKAGALIFGPIGAGVTTSGKALPQIQLYPSDGDKIRWRSISREKYDGVSASYHDAGGATRHTVHAGDAKGARKLKTVYASQAEAQRAAESEWRRIQRGAAELSVTLAIGRPDITPETKVRLFSGMKPQIDAATWLVKQVTHTLGDGGFTTALQLETAP